MKPDWDKLGEEYAASKSVVIGDADCTTDDAKALCNRMGVSGYPTIKYWNADTGKEGADYQKGRDYDSLKKFVDETLAGPACNVDDTADCDEREKTFIEKFKAHDAEKVKSELTRLNGMKGNSVKKELKQWILARINILEQLAAKA
mmetsp:Transcript_34062/g.79712  ORF Transcript_34062/g.79712 Transcript_34062/m.79712 type:complete len:146 (-) Transcript_34062:209-646(-)